MRGMKMQRQQQPKAVIKPVLFEPLTRQPSCFLVETCFQIEMHQQWTGMAGKNSGRRRYVCIPVELQCLFNAFVEFFASLHRTDPAAKLSSMAQ
jgi:hypothetical protein